MTFLKNLFANFLNLFKSNKVEKQLPDLEKELEARTIIHKFAEQMNPDDETEAYWKSRWIPDPKPLGVGTYYMPNLDSKSIDPAEPIVLVNYGERIPERIKLPSGRLIHRIWRSSGTNHLSPIDKTYQSRTFIWKEDIKRTSKLKKQKQKEEKSKQARQT